MWKPYEEIRNHPADFRVKYRFYTREEGGRKKPVLQGYRPVSYMMEVTYGMAFWYGHSPRV